ncbi:hypothetical protein B5F10_13940 [Anaerotruncus colihominis]|uniref:Uncharacterized protein n=1 Tax=Anaerotruncus colihominis TaxID=169435 RepID=A0A1Y4MVL8_9FIRM|nr:hypothetical protein B5F11_13845 [Anaerotruncus colihominis]OUP72734.1 hypothetical protein B5F10_13940 [Anaerotruncus colihominis]
MDPTPGQVQPVYAQRPPHCSRRSRLKFFAKLFFKKAGAQPIKVFRRSLFSKRLERSRLKFFPSFFSKKVGTQSGIKLGWRADKGCAGTLSQSRAVARAGFVKPNIIKNKGFTAWIRFPLQTGVKQRHLIACTFAADRHNFVNAITFTA